MKKEGKKGIGEKLTFPELNKRAAKRNKRNNKVWYNISENHISSGRNGENLASFKPSTAPYNVETARSYAKRDTKSQGNMFKNDDLFAQEYKCKSTTVLPQKKTITKNQDKMISNNSFMNRNYKNSLWTTPQKATKINLEANIASELTPMHDKVISISNKYKDNACVHESELKKGRKKKINKKVDK